MAKRKIYKDDGITEDFDAEAAEPDETAADGGNVADLLKTDEAAKADGGSSTDVKADVSTEAGEAPKAEAGADAEPVQPEAPADLATPHPEAQAAVDLNPEISEVLKEVGNKLTPLFEKFREADAKLHELEDEAKNRFAHARQKATELVAALEAWFSRG